MTDFLHPTHVSLADASVITDALELTVTTLDGLAPAFTARDVTFQHKPDGSIVSATDCVIHTRFATAIAASFPTHELISEEGVRVSGAARWRWVIDPLDGTSNFTSGLPFWCISVALTCDGQVMLAVIDAPALNRRFMAVSGGGTWVTTATDVRQVWVREAVNLYDVNSQHVPLMLTPTTLVTARSHRVELRQRVLGATALDLAFVADGTAAASVAVVPHVWDVAAGSLLVTEAGGVVLTETGVLLPLENAVDYQLRQGAVVAGATQTSVRELAGVVLPKSRFDAVSPLRYKR